MRSKIKWIYVCLLTLLFQVGFAQEKTLTGMVTEEGMPLPGVTVVIQGTQLGTQTDLDGKYSIKAKPGQVLVFSFIGLKDVKYTVGASSLHNVSMFTDENMMDEVIVVGYGTSTKESFTGSVTQIDSKEIEKKSVANAVSALAGEAAGVRVITSTGQPGAEPIVRIRGFGSVNGNRDPLYVVDGVPFLGNISSINPSDIETMSVLKDASATAIYGARGANGVVLLTTKSGKGKQSYVEVETRTGVNFRNLPQYDVVRSPEEFIGYTWEGMYNEGKYLEGSPDPVGYANESLFDPDYGIYPAYNMWNITSADQLIDPNTGKVRPGVTRKYNPEDWADYAFKASKRIETNLKMGGATDKTSYFTSLGYLNDEGYSLNSNYERVTARLNLQHKPKEWLDAKMNVGYAHSESNNNGQEKNSNNIFWFTDNLPSIYPLFLRDDKGNKMVDPYGNGYIYDYGEGRGFGALTNSIADATYGKNKGVRDEMNINASFNINIYDGLTFETSIGGQYYNNTRSIMNYRYYGSAASMGGSIYKAKSEVFTYNWLKLLRYKKTFGNHQIEALVAQENNSYEYRFLDGSKNDLANPSGIEFNNAAITSPSGSYIEQNRIESYFAQVNYDYSNKYFLSGTIRRDGSSKFKDNKWGTFGSVGGAWVVSRENFMANQSFISNLKLKASYGLTGDQVSFTNIGGIKQEAFYPGEDLWEVMPYDGKLAIVEHTVGNSALTWEKSKMFQTGIELGLGKFLDISVDYYTKNTNDLIFSRKTAPSMGYLSEIVNGGNLKNQGLEFNVVGHILQTKDAFIDLSINGEHMKNKLTKMPIDPTTGKQKPLDLSDVYGRAVGHSIGDYYTVEYAGVDAQTGVSQWYTYSYTGVDGTKSYVSSMTDFLAENPSMEGQLTKETTTSYNNATKLFVGKSAIPTLRGGVNLNAGYKGWELSVQMLYSIGGYAYDYSYAGLMQSDNAGANNWHKDIDKRWQNPGDITDVPRLSNGNDLNVISSSTRFLTKADYLSINNIRLGYTVPNSYVKQLGLASLSFYVTGDNLWLFTKRDGLNPGISEFGSSDVYDYAPLSTITGGVTIKF